MADPCAHDRSAVDPRARGEPAADPEGVVIIVAEPLPSPGEGGCLTTRRLPGRNETERERERGGGGEMSDGEVKDGWRRR